MGRARLVVWAMTLCIGAVASAGIVPAVSGQAAGGSGGGPLGPGASFAPPPGSVALMDQIGADPNDLGAVPYASQYFEAGYAAYHIVAADDFTVSGGPFQLTQVDAVLGAWNGSGNPYGSVQWYEVNIYSAPPAAGINLVGDVASVQVLPGSVILTDPYGAARDYPALAEIPLPAGIQLAEGTYWVGVIPRLDFESYGQTGVFETNFAGFPSNDNGFNANPNGGFGFPPGNLQQYSFDFAYRVWGGESELIPEPASLTLLALGGLGLLARRSRR